VDEQQSALRLRGLLGLGLGGLGEELLGELPLRGGVELLDLVLDGPAVVALVPVVERLEPALASRR